MCIRVEQSVSSASLKCVDYISDSVRTRLSTFCIQSESCTVIGLVEVAFKNIGMN